MSDGTKNGLPTGGVERSVDERMHILERKAKVVRSRLLRAVDALDARRHQVEKIGETAKDVAMPLAISAGAVVALFGASAIAFTFALRSRRRRSLSFRVSRALRGLELVQPKQASFGRRLVEKAAMSLVTLAATEIGKAALKNAVDGRFPDGRLAVGSALGAHHQNLQQQPPIGIG
jgi:hypothetical protein